MTEGSGKYSAKQRGGIVQRNNHRGRGLAKEWVVSTN